MAPSAPPPPFSASVIEQICRILADAVTGPEIPNLIAPFSKAPESLEEHRNTKWKRLFNAVITVQNRIRDGRPLVRLIVEVMAPVRFPSQAEFDATRALVNEKLEDVATVALLYDTLRAEALPVRASLEFIAKVQEAWT